MEVIDPVEKCSRGNFIGIRGPGRLQVWWVDRMDQGVEVVREGNLMSIREKMKSFSDPLIQRGVGELKFQTVFKYLQICIVITTSRPERQ
jgi:hypothetical protein